MRTWLRFEVAPEEKAALQELANRQCMPIATLMRPLIRRIIEPPPAPPRPPRRQAQAAR